MTSEGELPDQAERLVAQSELQTAEDGLQRDGRFWDAAWSWMLAQRALLSSQATSEARDGKVPSKRRLRAWIVVGGEGLEPPTTSV